MFQLFREYVFWKEEYGPADSKSVFICAAVYTPAE